MAFIIAIVWLLLSELAATTDTAWVGWVELLLFSDLEERCSRFFKDLVPEDLPQNGVLEAINEMVPGHCWGNLWFLQLPLPAHQALASISDPDRELPNALTRGLLDL